MDLVKGKKQIERMNYLMYNNTKKNIVTEGKKQLSNLEYKVKGNDGKYYGIVRENRKFIIKSTDKKEPLTEDFQYLNGILNSSKQSYNNFSDAVKFLNLYLMENCGVEHEVDETETEVDEKTVLKLKDKEPTPAPVKTEDPDFSKMGMNNLGDEDGMDDLGDNDGMNDLGDNEGGAPEEIQQTTGELGQKLRDMEEQDDETIKYVFNSIISALELEDLDPENKKELIKKVKKKIKGDEDNDDEDLDLNNDDSEDIENKSTDDFEEELGESKDSPFKDNINIKGKDAPFNSKLTKIKESKVHKIISKYFEKTKEEQDEEVQNVIFEALERNNLITEAKKLAKTVDQEFAIGAVLGYDPTKKVKKIGSRVIVEMDQNIDLGGKGYKKSIFIESNGTTYGVMRELNSPKKEKFRMTDKKDYQKFLAIGK